MSQGNHIKNLQHNQAKICWTQRGVDWYGWGNCDSMGKKWMEFCEKYRAGVFGWFVGSGGTVEWKGDESPGVVEIAWWSYF